MYNSQVKGVYSSKEKMLEAYVNRVEHFKDQIIEKLENELYPVLYRRAKEIKKEAIQEILNLFTGKEYDSSLFSFEDLSDLTNSDYKFVSLEIDL
jgi:hypothetical protein